MTAGPTPTESASTGELITRMAAQTSRLVRDEIRLAHKEFQESAKHAGIGAGLFSVAGAFAVFGAAALTGKRQVQEASPVPQRTVANMKDDIHEVKDASHDRT